MSVSAWTCGSVVLALACTVGSQAARADGPAGSRRADHPWWVVARIGGYATSSDEGFLSPAAGPPGGVALGTDDGAFLGVGAGRRLSEWTALELAWSRLDVEIGGDDLLEETGEGVAVEIGTGALNLAQLTLLIGPDAPPDRRFAWRLGLDLLYESPGAIEPAEAGRRRLGVVDVETRSALLGGISVRGDVRIGRGLWDFTMNGTITFGGAEPYGVRTDPGAGYLSDAVPFRPFMVTIGFLRRF